MARAPAPEAAYPTTDNTPSVARKRKRSVLSCLSCRRRKLKCDHDQPACGRCQEDGTASSCIYKPFPRKDPENQDEIDEPADENGGHAKRARGTLSVNSSNGKVVTDVPPVAGPAHFPQADKIAHLEDRLRILEGIVTRVVPASEAVASTECAVLNQKDGKPKDSGGLYFKGRGFRTQFYGASCPMTLIAYFPEVRVMMKEAHPGSELERVQTECSAMEIKYKRNEAWKLKQAPSELVGLVPARPMADYFVRLYLNTFEKTYRILHEPTFWDDYEAFWKSPGDSRPGFVPTLLLMLATVRAMSSDEAFSFDTEGLSPREESVVWIQSCDSWLKAQSQKHRTMAMYQVMCLRALAASAICLKVKQAYLDIEDLLQYFKAAGMHRDPSLLGARCSVFDMEMRRRLWATVMELELQTCLDRGIPPSLTSIPFDCNPPLNINDEDLVVDALHSPSAKPLDEYTSTSYLHIASKSLPLRITLCSLINGPNSQLDFPRVLQLEKQINDEIDAIPQWSDWVLDKGHKHTSYLLDLQFRELLILLYTPFARHAQSSQNRYSRMVCFETSKHILDQHSSLVSSGNLTHSLIREDIFRAAFSICHNSFLCTLIPGDIFFQGILANLTPLLDAAFRILGERSLRRGRGYQQFWYVSAAFSLVQTRLHPERAVALTLQATERVAELYRKTLAHMEMALLPGAGDGLSALGGRSAPPEEPLGASSGDGLNDLFDTSNWTLDNLWSLEGGYDPSVLW